MSDWHLSASAAVAGLVAAARQVAGPDVYDSLVIGSSGAKEALVVAGAVDVERPTAEHYIAHLLDIPRMSSNVVDTFTVYNEVAVLNGSADMAAARDRAYVIVQGWGQRIAADQTLGGAVKRAYIREVAYEARQDQRGATAVLTVAVDCQTFTHA